MTDRMTDEQLEESIRRELLSVSAPAELRQKLLQVSALPAQAANDSLFRRILPVAACLAVALGITLWTTNDQHEALEDALEKEIFAHMYLEGQLDNATASVIPLSAVNDRMEQVMGAHLEMSEAVSDLQVTFAKDCWVAQQVAFHLIMKGKTGAVTVMMIPSESKDAEFDISDERFNGLVTPTDGGYLVVVGNKQEPIAEYRNLLSRNLGWEY